MKRNYILAKIINYILIFLTICTIAALYHKFLTP